MTYAGGMTETTQPAGEFSSWLAQIRNGGEIDVPCGDCNACCRASYFIQIQPQEQQALAHIPVVLRVPAPGQANGTFAMGFNEKGCCPMLHNEACSIYESRPQTCRDYDCRIFAACGITAGGEEKLEVNAQVARWRFEYPTATALQEQHALSAAMQFLQTKAELFATGTLPENPTQLALLAIGAYHLFLDQGVGEQDLAAAISKIIERRQS